MTNSDKTIFVRDASTGTGDFDGTLRDVRNAPVCKLPEIIRCVSGGTATVEQVCGGQVCYVSATGSHIKASESHLISYIYTPSIIINSSLSFFRWDLGGRCELRVIHVHSGTMLCCCWTFCEVVFMLRGPFAKTDWPSADTREFWQEGGK